jgi:aspartyl-tRNA synthetase
MQLLKRTVFCGQVTKELLGSSVSLNGWVHRRRDHGGVIFVDLRDRSGLVQLVFDPSVNAATAEAAHALRAEFVIAVQGNVVARSPEAVNDKLPTGHIEVHVTTLHILNKASALPFQIDDEGTISEELRLKYRYLDLRRQNMHNNLKLRHDVIFAMRNYFNGQGFYEIETPVLSKSTPGGARNFLVPSRSQPGTFYGLVESPQIYKQLLMVGGMERYFQIARCFRDEALRASRQPEFTQLDIEMAFIDEEAIQTVCEGLFKILWKQFLNIDLALPLKRYSFDDVFNRFGSDKPDMRFGLEIQDVTAVFKQLDLSFIKSVLSTGGKAGCVVVKDQSFSRTDMDRWSDRTTKELGAKGLLWFKWREDGSVESPITKFLPADFLNQLQTVVPSLTKDDALFVVIGDHEEAWTVLGQLRLALGKELRLIDNSAFELFWVTDFPMFEYDKDGKKWVARHHQFTSPQTGWENQELKDIKARAYDLVCNGEELGGGSIRIHSAEVQSKIFDLLGMTREKAEEKFKFLLDAQTVGYPPEGGVAFGIDRLIMILSGAEAIRDVIAFPKTQNGSCLMMSSPSTVEDAQLRELQIKSTYIDPKTVQVKKPVLDSSL